MKENKYIVEVKTHKDTLLQKIFHPEDGHL